MFRSVSSVDPSAAALASAWRTGRRSAPLLHPGPQPGQSSGAVTPFADHLSTQNARHVQASRVVLPYDMAIAAQNHATRASKELARALLAAMPRRVCPQDVAAAVRVLQALSAYTHKPGAVRGALDLLA